MRTGGDAKAWKVVPLAAGGTVVYKSPVPAEAFAGSPSLLALPGGRLIAAFDLTGPGVKALPGGKAQHPLLKSWMQGKIYTSNDRGQTWSVKHEFTFGQPRLFRCGNDVYLLGHRGGIQILRSTDGGETWGRPADLTTDSEAEGRCTLSHGNVLQAHGHVYCAMMTVADPDPKGNLNDKLALVAMRAPEGGNLMSPKGWSFSAPAGPLRTLVPFGRLDYLGVPFYDVPQQNQDRDVGKGRWAGRYGWRDPQLVTVADPAHYWHRPAGRPVHILASAYTHRTNFAVLARIDEDEQGRPAVRLESCPARKRFTFLPVPGGHLGFSVVYDEPSKLYWLAGNQGTDSMTRADRLPAERHGLPCDESHRLQLHFSRNLVDWCFAGLVDAGPSPRAARAACSLAVRGQDLGILCRSGDAESRNAQETHLVTFHLVEQFRELAY